MTHWGASNPDNGLTSYPFSVDGVCIGQDYDAVVATLGEPRYALRNSDGTLSIGYAAGVSMSLVEKAQRFRVRYVFSGASLCNRGRGILRVGEKFDFGLVSREFGEMVLRTDIGGAKGERYSFRAANGCCVEASVRWFDYVVTEIVFYGNPGE